MTGYSYTTTMLNSPPLSLREPRVHTLSREREQYVTDYKRYNLLYNTIEPRILNTKFPEQCYTYKPPYSRSELLSCRRYNN